MEEKPKTDTKKKDGDGGYGTRNKGYGKKEEMKLAALYRNPVYTYIYILYTYYSIYIYVRWTFMYYLNVTFRHLFNLPLKKKAGLPFIYHSKRKLVGRACFFLIFLFFLNFGHPGNSKKSKKSKKNASCFFFCFF